VLWLRLLFPMGDMAAPDNIAPRQARWRKFASMCRRAAQSSAPLIKGLRYYTRRSSDGRLGFDSKTPRPKTPAVEVNGESRPHKLTPRKVKERGRFHLLYILSRITAPLAQNPHAPFAQEFVLTSAQTDRLDQRDKPLIIPRFFCPIRYIETYFP
jgi:hypothetical protein